MKGIYLESDLLKSSAFSGLSKWALKVYLRFLTKRVMTQFNSTKHKSKERTILNNGEITFCYSEAKAMGIGEREFRNAIDELIERGFLDLTHQGTGGLERDKSKYFIDTRWKKWNTPEFSPAKKPRQKNTKQGRGWEAYNAKQKQKLLANMSAVKPGLTDNYARSLTENGTSHLTDLSLH